MNESPLVLNYATPVSKRRTANPLRTRLLCDRYHGGVAFTEVSADKPYAFGVMAFCCIPLVTLGVLMYSLLGRASGSVEFVSFSTFAGVLWLTLLALQFCVLNRTLKRTRLASNRERLTLVISAPLGSRTRSWEVAQIQDIAVNILAARTADLATAQIAITPRGGESLTLFSNYGEDELQWVVSLIRAELYPPPPLPVAPA